MNPQSEGRPVTGLELFERENERILRESQQADREAREKIATYEKRLGQIDGRCAKAVGQFEKLRADFERIEADTLESERRRIAAAAVKKEDVLSGSATSDEYFRSGQAQAAIDTAARAETAKKLQELLGAVRTKALEVLKLEAEKAECEKEIVFLNTYSSASLLERMRAQVKSLETFLVTAASGGMNWTSADEKLAALKRATGGIADTIWRELDLAAAKRLRFDAGIPESELPKLLEIVAEMEARPGCRVDIRFNSVAARGENGLSVAVWR